MSEPRSFDTLLAEALARPTQGWDFGWLRERGRFEEGAVPWDYDWLVRERERGSPDLLDLGTGGGERLATFRPHPSRTVATEAYAPNVQVAGRRLLPLGIQVIHVAGAPDNALQRPERGVPSLPFRDGSFHLVIDRNESFVAREVSRILAPGGTFLTEQTGTSEISEISKLFDLPVPSPAVPTWDLRTARDQVVRAGLRVTKSAEAEFEMAFHDIGALVWYLRMVPWAVPRFSTELQRPRLEDLHSRMSREGPLRIPRYGFWLEARK